MSGFQIIGFILLILFYGCYFYKMVQQHRQGIATDHMGEGKVGFVKAVEMILKVTAFIVPIVEIISIIRNINSFPEPVRILGVVIGICGTVAFVCSVIAMGDSWRAGVSKTEKTELITEGIYQISRNPAFLGFDLVYIGICMMFFNPLLFGISLFGMIMFHLQIVNVEEDYLMETFGDEYLAYRKKVNRYLGRKNGTF